MGFTTPIFLFVLFPISIVAAAACRWLERHISLCRRMRLEDWALAGISLAFYGWTLFDGIYRLSLYILAVWAIGQLLQALRSRRPTLHDGAVSRFSPAHLVFWAAVGLALALLFRYKYWDFTVTVWNDVLHRSFETSPVLAPLGISFLTFSAISYLADIWRGAASAGNLLDCLLYLAFFPKVASGPIVLWRDFRPQIKNRRTSVDDVTAGLERIMIGFAKKLILADMLSMSNVDVVSAWLAALLYMLRIYYDFAGYSDIAIGLSRLFGFHFSENFNFPYRSTSITEFWRRWHISLGAWFREYVYIPLGGSRRGLPRTLCNLAVVFALTGIWHGAGWNYILWGGINAFFVLLERIIRDKAWYKKIPNGIRWLGTMLIVMLFWELFRFQSVPELWDWLKVMLGLYRFEAYIYSWLYYFDLRMVCLTVIGILGATIPGNARVQKVCTQFFSTRIGFALKSVGLLLVFALAILCMVNSNYSPFIYFQY